ncbi:MAG: RHS repeat-associated core domain-containing protein [Candidatus Sulfotelmatobacter sp.]
MKLRTAPLAVGATDLDEAAYEEYIFFNGDRIARVDRPSGTVHYYFSDQLGSASVIASASGGVQEQYFYYPYGGMQSSVGSDPNHYKFNGKERDTESGLDNFGARFDSSSLGRFMTPDWAAKPITVPYAKFGDPQSLNLYSFVENSPINRIDPDGHVTSGDFRCPDQRHCVDQSPTVGDSCDNEAGNCYTADRSNAFILLAQNQALQHQNPQEDGSEVVTNSVRRGFKWYKFITGWINKGFEEQKLKSEVGLDRTTADIMFGIIAQHPEALNRFPQAIEIYQLEQQNLLYDQGRTIGKVMGEVPNLPGMDRFGNDVFNFYGQMRDQNNRRIDALIQEGLASQ